MSIDIFVVGFDGTGSLDGKGSLKRSAVRFDGTGSLKCLVVRFDEVLYHLAAFTINSLVLWLI